MQELFDVAIIGGGFSGLGIAREASFHGFRTILLEAAEIGNGTSLNSLRIVHGGLRYLQSGAFDRMLQSAQAHSLALQRYPDFVKALPCLMPLEKFGPRSRWPVQAALSIYHLFSPISHAYHGAVLPRTQVEKIAPTLKSTAPYGALLWWDAVIEDPLTLAHAVAAESVSLGADIRINSSVVSLDLGRSDVRISVITPAGQSEIRSKVVINAAGPMIGTVTVPGVSRPKITWCRSFNLVFRKQLEAKYAIASRGRGRLLFSVPRDSATAIGTWYLPLFANDLKLKVEEVEIQAALEDVRSAFPSLDASVEDIEEIEVGILPVSKYSKHGEPIPMGREQILVSGRYTELISTKLTTFEVQATKILRKVSPLLE